MLAHFKIKGFLTKWGQWLYQNVTISPIARLTVLKIMANITENCSFPESEDFFSGLFENRPSKVIFVIVSIVGGFVLLPLVYSIIWFEQFGSDKKRTLINKFVSSVCWTCFEWFFTVQVRDKFNWQRIRSKYFRLPANEKDCINRSRWRIVCCHH